MRRRPHRDKEGAFLVEGPVVVQEAVEAGADVREIFVARTAELGPWIDAAERGGVAVHSVTDPVLASICDTRTPQGIAAVVGWREAGLDDVVGRGALVVVLADVRDPGNAGTLLRSAVAAAATGVVVARGSVDPLHAKTVRASAGAVFRIPIVRDVALVDAVEGLRARGVLIVGADARAGTAPEDVALEGPVALVLGNEAWGLPPEHAGLLDTAVGIPMPGRAESLNVAIAGSILLFEAVRRRRLSSASP